MKRWMTALMVALMVLLTFGAVASAAEPTAAEGTRPGRPGGRGDERVTIVAEMLGMQPREIVTALRGGQTIADLAGEEGVALDEIVAAILAPQAERLAAQVADGTLTQAQADYLSHEAEEYAYDYLTLPTRIAHHARELADLATVLGVAEETLVARLTEGETVAEIVAGQSQSVEEIVAEMVDLRDKELSERAALDLLTETQKGRALRHYESQLTRLLSGERTQR